MYVIPLMDTAKVALLLSNWAEIVEPQIEFLTGQLSSAMSLFAKSAVLRYDDTLLPMLLEFSKH